MESSEKIVRITGKTLFQQVQEEFLSLVKQAQAGDITSQYNVGLCYLYGQNTTVDYNEAYQWFEKAAQQGDKLAGLFLGYINELGIGRVVNYTKAINNYKTYSPSICEVDKTALWEKAKKIDENEIEKKLSDIYDKAIKIGESILKIKGFCVYYPKDNSFNFKWNDTTRSELKKPLEEYNKLVEEFKVYLDAYTSDSDDEKYGYWIYLYEDTLNLTYEICNTLVGRDTLFRYLDKVGLLAIEKNKNFEFALGRCLIDDNDDTDNDYIISGLLLVAGHDEDPIWQNKVGLWYEFRNENKDLLQAEFWYKKAATQKLSEAQVNIDRLKGEKEYILISDNTEGSAEDRLKIVKSFRGNEELRNKWLLAAASMGNEGAMEQLTNTIDIKGDSIYNKTCDFEPSWKRIELEHSDCNKKNDTWKKQVEADRKNYIEEEKRRIKKEEEAARRKAAEEEARRKAAEEEEKRRQEEIDALFNENSNSKKWIWILLIVLLVAGGAWFMYNDISSNSVAPVEAVDNDSIDICDAIEDIEEDIPKSELDFLEYFYKGPGTEDFICQNVTSNVLNKLKKDAEKDGHPGSLAVWAFNAYDAGTDGPDMEYEEGPIISKTDIERKYCVSYRYNYYDEPKLSRERKVYLNVTKQDGKYLISNYEVVGDNSGGNKMSDGDENGSQLTMVGKVSQYGIHMVLDINGSEVNGYYYYDSQGSNNRVTLKGSISNGNMKLNKYNENGEETGYFEGNFNGNMYSGSNVNYEREQALLFSLRVEE